MMSFHLSQRSWKQLVDVHPDLVRVIENAIQKTEVDFTVLEGVRTLIRQRTLIDSGASTTMNSRHLTGHAVDLGAYVDGRIAWDWPLYHKIAAVMKDVAQVEGVAITWGGDWTTFPDGPHYQLSWDKYPKGT